MRNIKSPVKLWRRQKLIRKYLGKRGKIVSFTRIFAPSQTFKKQAPFYVAIVELEGGERLVGQVVEAEEGLKIGDKVVAVIRRLWEGQGKEVLPYTLKFIPRQSE